MGGSTDRAAARVVADADVLAADLLVGGSEVAAVPNDHIHGLGVVVAGEKVYAVYRYCNLGY